MKKILLSALCFCSGIAAFGQCNELFISEYVEGYGNNRALEIYNPTANPVDLSQMALPPCHCFVQFECRDTHFHLF